MAGLLNAGANGTQSNSWSNSAHKSIALNARLIQKDAVARVSQSDSASSREANLPRILVHGEGASLSSGGSETRSDIFFAKNQIERENEIPALRRRAP
jgi:hypothetical protein